MPKLAVNILLEQLKDAHNFLASTMEGVTDEVGAYMPAGKANPIAGIYAHLTMGEDMFVQMFLQGKPTLFTTTWKDKTGADSEHPTEWEHEYPKWLKSVKVDIKQMNAYYKAVGEASEAYLAGLSDEELLREVDMSSFGMGKNTVASILGGMVIGHARDIMGEISVIKGLQDLKGYPF